MLYWIFGQINWVWVITLLVALAATIAVVVKLFSGLKGTLILIAAIVIGFCFLSAGGKRPQAGSGSDAPRYTSEQLGAMLQTGDADPDPSSQFTGRDENGVTHQYTTVRDRSGAAIGRMKEGTTFWRVGEVHTTQELLQQQFRDAALGQPAPAPTEVR